MHLRSFLALLAALTSATLIAGLAPGSATGAVVVAKDTAPPPRTYVTGWLPYWLPETATDAVVNNKGVFDDASPFVFDAQSATDIDLQMSADAWRSMRTRLRSAGVDNIPTLTTDLSADQFAALLSNRSRRTAHVRTLVKLADRYNVDGLDLDYESINFGSSSAKNTVRKLYPVLVRTLEGKLQRAGRLLSVTVAARTSVNDPNWWVYDYRALGGAADRFRLMTYDYHWSGGSPGPMAPKSWVDDVVSFATRQVDPRKISFGLPAYGRDWFGKTISGNCPSSARATISRSTRDMQRFAANLGVKPQWSVSGTSQTFTYVKTYRSGSRTCRAKRVVWYDDARSVAAKATLVEKYQIRGVALWALGYESNAIWEKLKSYGRQIAAREPVVAVTAPERLTYGSSGTVEAVVRSAGSPVAGTRVELQRRTGTAQWVAVDSRRTTDRGRATFTVTPQRHVQWRVQTGNGWALLPHTTTPTTTRVAYDVRLNDSERAVARGSKWTVSGTIAKPTSGVTVVRQKRVDGAWVDRNSQKVRADGSFSFTLRSRGSGEHVLRVIALSAELDRGVSRSLKVAVN